jgi:hypothetical protein
MRKIVIVFAFCMLILLAGCSDNDKSELIDWMQELDAQQTNVFFWAQENDWAEIELTSEEKLRLLSLLSELTPEDITWNKQQAGITPEYGFHLSVGDDDYYINQAEAPHGQTEIHFQGKQWWLESAELFELMKSFLNAS